MSTAFHLPVLRQLAVTCWDWKEMVSRVLLCFIAPALESLEVCVLMESNILVGIADVLQDFLSRRVALRALTLTTSRSIDATSTASSSTSRM